MARVVHVAHVCAVALLLSTGAAADEPDDEIIIIEDEDAEPRVPASQVTGALGRLWETWHVGADSDLLGSLQLVEPADGNWRLLGSFWVESSLLPAPNLSVHANGFARLALDATPTGRLVPSADLYEAYAKLTLERAAVNAGRIVVPWVRTQAAAIGDRVSPPDLRRGPPFPDPVRQKQPSWGAWVRTSLGPVGVEGIAMAQYEPSEGSLAAANQGGVRVARYQTALVRSPARAGGLLVEDDTSALRGDYEFARTGTLAARASRRLGGVDLGGSVVWGFDETPRLHLRPDVARALVAEVAALLPGEELPLACAAPDLACVGGSGTLDYQRQTSFSVDASWGFGVVIVRAEALVVPKLGGLGGKQALLLDAQGLRSEPVSQYAAVLAAEGGLGDWIDGSVELFDVVWDGVPADAKLWGVELLGDLGAVGGSDTRMVHRVATALSVGGAFAGDRVAWKVRGEAGVLQPDVLVAAELRYRFPALGLYVGGRSELYTGMAGSPGWMRQDASMVGVFVGEGG
ncbi:MAG: hypothetical protein HYS27_19235 [Deltaproteobacteria bacterium]|nr:hypothetical protein [Deltaproteobacteria bacterium]